jgi:hypothetical protein
MVDIQHYTDWYGIPTEFVRKNGGKSLLYHHKNSLTKGKIDECQN